MTIIYYEKLLEFHDLFPEEQDLNICEVLRKYNRKYLVDCATTLSYNFINARIPDDNTPFFSECSSGHLDDLNRRLTTLTEGEHKNYCYIPLKTALELMRFIFSIPMEEYENNWMNEDFEYDIFRVILQINENLMRFESNEETDLTSLMFLHFFVMNDISNADEAALFTRQALYYSDLSNFIENDDRCKKARTHFYEKAGIQKMSQYSKTWLSLFAIVVDAKENPQKGCPMIDLKTLIDPDDLITRSVLDFLSIGINDFIPYDSNDAFGRNDNVDYRSFRAHPLIKKETGEYLIYNSVLLVNRLYNGLFFDFKDYFKDAFYFYNKEFVEKKMFLPHILKCVEDTNCSAMFPTRLSIVSDQILKEAPNQPDFYIREGNNVILFECKAIRINGKLKDNADINEIIKILRNKLYESKENIDKTRGKKKSERVGVTQLVHQMEMISNHSFKWDSNIPSNACYYPVIVIEDPNIVVPGISGIINNWYKQLIEQYPFRNKCFPIIVMSVNTLMRHYKAFRICGFHKIFDEYYKVSSLSRNKNIWSLNSLAMFDEFIGEQYPLSIGDRIELFDESKVAMGIVDNLQKFDAKVAAQNKLI